MNASQWGYDLAYIIWLQKASPMLRKSSLNWEDK